MKQTCDFSFEWTANYVLWPAVFDSDQIVARGHWGVCDLVAFRTLATVHFDLRGPINVDRESS